MATRLDKWLKGLDDFADLDTAEVEQLVADLRAQVDSAQMKIAVLEQLLRRRRPRAPRAVESASAARAATGAAAPSANGRPGNWKGRAVLSLMEAEPDRVWSAADMRQALRDSGAMTADEGTPTKLLLTRLAKRGQVVERGPDAFSFRPPQQGVL